MSSVINHSKPRRTQVGHDRGRRGWSRTCWTRKARWAALRGVPYHMS